MRASGISGGFPLLSRSSGQVAHVLLTRSPLGLPQGCPWLGPVRLACVKHAASVRPEPGSNSPSRSPGDPRASRTPWRAGLPGRTRSDRLAKNRLGCPFSAIDVLITQRTARSRTGFWLSSVPFSRCNLCEARVSQRSGGAWRHLVRGSRDTPEASRLAAEASLHLGAAPQHNREPAVLSNPAHRT